MAIRGEGKWLFLALLLGFALRVYGVQFGLPFLYHADEPIVVNHALAYGSGDLNPHFFKIPPLLSYLLFGFYGLSYLAGKVFGIFKSPADFEFLFLSDPTFFYLSARILSGVLPGVVSIFFLYRLAKKHFSLQAALLAAFFLSVSFLHVRDSHYIYSDIPLILLLILTFDRIFFMIDHPESLKGHLGAGLLIGLSCAMKYNGAAFAIPYAAGILISAKPRAFFGSFCAAGLASFIFILLNPYAVLDAPTFLREIRIQSQAQAGTPWLHHLSYSLWEGAGPAAVFFALGGAFQAIRAKSRKHLLLVLFAAAYYLILVKAAQPYDRYVLPLLVPVILLAADFVSRHASGPHSKKSLFLLMVVLVFLPNLAKSLLSGAVLSAKDTRTEAKEWIEANIPGGSALALGWEFFLPRLNFSEEQLREKKENLENGAALSGVRARRLDFYLQRSDAKRYRLFFLREDAGSPDENRTLFASPTVPCDIQTLRERGIEYVLIPVVSEEMKPALFYEALKREAEHVRRFSPYRLQRLVSPLDSQPLTGGPFLWLDLIPRARNGTIIDIYKLRKP